MNTSCILAQSVTMGGEVYLHFWQIGAPPVLLRGFVFLLKQAGSVHKIEKNECDGETTNLVVVKKRAGKD